MKKKIRIRSSVVPREPPTTSEEKVGSRLGFLQLPGEIRNQIYCHEIYPKLDSVTVVNCCVPEELGGSTLHLSLFRVCRQLRAETLSFLCATKTIKIMGIETANSFFNVVGVASRDLKRVVIVQHTWEAETLRMDSVDKFFTVIDEAEELKYFQLLCMGYSSPKLIQEEARHKLSASIANLEKVRKVEVELTGHI